MEKTNINIKPIREKILRRVTNKRMGDLLRQRDDLEFWTGKGLEHTHK